LKPRIDQAPNPKGLFETAKPLFSYVSRTREEPAVRRSDASTVR
jgi:hypothetical protein